MPKGKSIALHITLHRLAGFIWLTYQKPISNKLPCLTTGINSNDRCYQNFLVTDWQVKPIIYIFPNKVCFQNKEREERCKRGREHLNITCEKLTRSERQQICHKKTKQEQNTTVSVQRAQLRNQHSPAFIGRKFSTSPVHQPLSHIQVGTINTVS